MNVFFKTKEGKLKRIDVDIDSWEDAIEVVKEWAEEHMPMQTKGAFLALIK